ncbi:MAG: chemotaxis protein CheW [Chromatiales bacterium]|jgi:chemosensory pili system protein ChpC|nr:chemotaxis protein CheW [Chromatiales bacterium]
MQSNDEIYSLLVPLHGERVILPRASVAEVVRYAEPEQSAVGPDWLLGKVMWHGKPIPLLSFEKLCGDEGSEPGSRSRIIVIYALNPTSDLVMYGLLAEGFPQIVRVNREVLLQDLAYQPDPAKPILCRIRMINETALIPDLQRVELALLAQDDTPDPKRTALQ